MFRSNKILWIVSPNLCNAHIVSHAINIPLRLRKAGRVWSGGAQETQEPHVRIG